MSILANATRMAIRAPINPLDVTSIISIFPKVIAPERKHTIQPGVFQIPFGTLAEPGILEVGPSSWWKETDEGQPLLEIPHSSITIAHSIVRDYAIGLLACDMGDKRPGIFYIPGKVTKDDLKKKTEYLALLQQANERQRNWFLDLVKIADVLWARTSGNPLTISDDMKLAAKELTLDKPWVKDFQSFQMINCKACGALKNPIYPVCPSCKAIDDPKKDAELGITFAK
jgi:hypothetical protein